MSLHGNRLRSLPDGVFDDLTSLQSLHLRDNQLTTLPDVFGGLSSLRELDLSHNQLTTLPDGVFDGLTSLWLLDLQENQLTTLPDGVFDSLTGLQDLRLNDNLLTALPHGVFDRLTGLQSLTLHWNQLTTLPDGVFDSLTNYDRGHFHLHNNRLTTLPDGVFDSLTRVEVLVLHDNQLTTLPDGVFDGMTSLRELNLHNNRLTTLPDVFDGLTNLQVLELGSNQLTTLPRGVFDGLTGQFATLDLSNNRLTTLPDGVFDGMTGLQTLDLRDNHLVGLTLDSPLFAAIPSDADILLSGQTAPPDQPDPPSPDSVAAVVPLMLSTSDSMRQGFVRIINQSEDSGSVRVFAVDDGGYAPNPIEFPLGARQVVHFNSDDLEDGNARKNIEGGVGGPVQGDWRLTVETALQVRVLAFVRTTDGFLTAMHDVLSRSGDGRLVAQTFNPGGNMNQVSKLRLVNTGADDESVSIEGVDDQGNVAGPVTLTLPAGQSRTLSAFDLENGARGLTGTLGDGAGKWRLFVDAGESVVGVSLLEAVSGHLTNISTTGVADQGNGIGQAEGGDNIWWAIARCDDPGVTSYAWGYSQVEPVERAVNDCRNISEGETCRIIGTWGSGCGALVFYHTGEVLVATGDTRQEAIDAAISECESNGGEPCELNFHACGLETWWAQ